LQDDGEEVEDGFSERVSQESSRMASQGLRVLGLAFKRCCPDENYSENDLIFIGLIGLIDPPKDGVKEAIVTCQEAGISVKMITGDHVKTATAIATQLGIFDPNHLDKVLELLRNVVQVLISVDHRTERFWGRSSIYSHRMPSLLWIHFPVYLQE